MSFREFREACEMLVAGHGVPLERPPKGIDADLAFPCFALAKKMGKAPQEIANEIASKLKPRGLIRGIKAEGAYVNFYADWEALGTLVLGDILGKKHGKSGKSTVMVEFAHPNTHKAFHMGHARNISIGSALARLLEYDGCKVVRANYQGDVGPHVAKCLWGYLHRKELGLKEPTNKNRGRWLGDVYAAASRAIEGNPHREQEIREMSREIYEIQDRKFLALWKKTRKWSLDYFSGIYRDFNAKFDRLYFESETARPGIAIVKELAAKGVAKVSDGAIIMDFTHTGKGVFVLLRSDGAPLYSTKDIGLATLEFSDFGVDKVIHVVGVEQKLYFEQLFETLRYINREWAEKSYHLAYELVMLKEGKMSSREGNVVLYDDVLAEGVEKAEKELAKRKSKSKVAKAIALAAIKYSLLSRDSNRPIIFDWDEALSFEGDTGPYLLYTYARAKSILRKSKVRAKAKVPPLGPREIALLRKIAQFDESAERSAGELKPHILANYLFDLATLFNEYYHAERIIGSRHEASLRGLVEAVSMLLKTGLHLLGIETVERM